MADEPDAKRLLTTDDVCALASISRESLKKYVRRGTAPAPDGHLGRTPYWHWPTVRAWLAHRAELAAVPTASRHRSGPLVVPGGGHQAGHDGAGPDGRGAPDVANAGHEASHRGADRTPQQ